MHLAWGDWRALHDAKNDLTAAVLLLRRSQAGKSVDLALIETLIRRAATRIDDVPCDLEDPRGAFPAVANR